MSLQIIHSGYEEVFDVCQIHLFKLNDIQSYSTVFSLNENDVSKVEEYKNLVNEFSEPSRRLKLFFDLEYHKVSFMSQYFLKYKKKYSSITLADLIEIVKKDKAFKDQVLKYYLERSFETDKEIQYALMTEYPELSDSFKLMLHDFVNFYEEYVELLCESLRTIRKEVEAEYQRSNLLLKRLQAQFDISLLTENDKDINKWMTEQNSIAVSFSLCSPYVVIYGENEGEGGHIILGVDYVTLIEQEWKARLSIVEVCKALGDTMRMSVVEDILQFGELSASTLAKKYGQSVKAMFYHLEILKNARVLSSRTRGRNTLYSINETTCQKYLENIKFLGGKTYER